MSREGDVLNWQQSGVGPLAPGWDIPRVLYPLYKTGASIVGLDIVRDADDTAHEHMMQVFYGTPRANLHRLSDVLAIRSFIPLSQDWTALVLEVDDPVNLHIVPITGDPEIRKKVYTAHEVFRRPKISSLWGQDVRHPSLDQMIVCYDEHADAIGSVVATEKDGKQSGILTIISHEDGLRKVGASVFRFRQDDELKRLFTLADVLLGPESEFARETGNQATIEGQYVFENALQTLQLLDRFRGDKDALAALYAICASPATESLICFCDNKRELEYVTSLVKQLPPWLMELCDAYSTLCYDTITAGDPDKLIYERPFAYRIYELGYDLIKTALFHHDDPEFQEDYLRASFRALYDTLNELHNINLPSMLPKEQDMYSGLSDYAVANAANMVALSLISPIVEQYFLLKLKRIIPGEFDKAREFFYSAIGMALNEHASEATGDDELQLSLIVDVFQELTKHGYWKKGNILQDAGSGDGKRILLPFLNSPVMQEAKPSIVYAVDAGDFPQPDHGQWIFVQEKFENPDFPLIHAKRMKQKNIVPIDAILEVWSSPNDLDASRQQQMFDNFARSLRKREGVHPGGVLVMELPMGYIEAMIKYAEEYGSREMGRAPLHYPIGEGKTLEKPLEIMLVHNVIIRAMRAGFLPLNLPPSKGDIKIGAFYQTNAGKDRAILVFERVGDPHLTLEQAALVDGRVLVGSGRPDRQA